jgi:hypothetical protein
LGIAELGRASPSLRGGIDAHPATLPRAIVFVEARLRWAGPDEAAKPRETHSRMFGP